MGRQVKQLDLLGAFAHPFGDERGRMDFQVVQDQKDVLGLVGDQLAEEFDEQRRVHGRFDPAEPDESLVADGRPQRQSRPAAGSRQHRRFPLGGITPDPMAIVHHGRLVAPVNQRLFRLRAG